LDAARAVSEGAEDGSNPVLPSGPGANARYVVPAYRGGMTLAETVGERHPRSATHGRARRVDEKTLLLTIIALMAILALFLFAILHG
jgi:hypothetical protein